MNSLKSLAKQELGNHLVTCTCVVSVYDDGDFWLYITPELSDGSDTIKIKIGVKERDSLMMFDNPYYKG